MGKEEKLKELLDSVANAPKDQLFISMSNGEGGLNMVAMNQDQSLMIDMMLRSVSAQGPFVRTPIELIVKEDTVCDYCLGEDSIHLRSSFGKDCSVSIDDSELSIDCIQDDENRYSLDIKFCPFCGRKLKEEIKL